ncbi:MAG TPA: hypothetical protein PKU74_07005, partial [Candidatus Omnitrophota bacterium]|nr:hypothetical protein [Candidatus Omnitrophota bacterium]
DQKRRQGRLRGIRQQTRELITEAIPQFLLPVSGCHINGIYDLLLLADYFRFRDSHILLLG